MWVYNTFLFNPPAFLFKMLFNSFAQGARQAFRCDFKFQSRRSGAQAMSVHAMIFRMSRGDHIPQL